MRAQSLLSLASLGGVLPPSGKKSYKKNGIRVTKLLGQRYDRNKRYPICVVHPTKGWWPSKTANFVFKSKKFDPQYIIRVAADLAWNPSVWLHGKSGRYVVRVPKDRGEEVRQRLYRRGLWYNPATNVWHRRRRRSRKFGYPSFIQSLSAQKRGEQLYRARTAQKKKKLSFKISRKT